MPSPGLLQNVRNKVRHNFDAAFCKSFSDKETLGDGSQWTMLTRDMNPDTVIYSGGVGEDISFELELIHRFGVKVHIFDPSPVGRNTIANALKDSVGLEKYLLFKPVGLASTAIAKFSTGGGNHESVWLKAATQEDGETLPCTTIPAEMYANNHDHIDLLKMDIEGFEYEILDSCLRIGLNIKQICVEFHDFYPNISKLKTFHTITHLKQNGFTLIHKHRHDHTFYSSDHL